ncbi:hypothetical protein C8R45DRAFT_947769 [Mycena sanguinolenta]|nr:hypothetical protein C8R45DRAFT_947769 [Mycena sanguinolenta]
MEWALTRLFHGGSMPISCSICVHLALIAERGHPEPRAKFGCKSLGSLVAIWLIPPNVVSTTFYFPNLERKARTLQSAREVYAEGPVHFSQPGKFVRKAFCQPGKFVLKGLYTLYKLPELAEAYVIFRTHCLEYCLSCTKAGTSWTKASWSVRTVKNRRVHTLWLAREVCPEGYIHFGQLATLVLNNLSKSVLHGYVHFSQLRKFVLKGTYTSAMFRPSQEVCSEWPVDRESFYGPIDQCFYSS